MACISVSLVNKVVPRKRPCISNICRFLSVLLRWMFADRVVVYSSSEDELSAADEDDSSADELDSGSSLLEDLMLSEDDDSSSDELDS